MVDQAHEPGTNAANPIDEPWYQVEHEISLIPPISNPMYGAHTYYWRVRSYNADGEYSVWSVVRSLRITVDRPTNLVMTDCAGVTIIDAITPRPCFDWDDVYKAKRYIVGISKKNANNTFTTLFSGISGASQYQIPIDLPKDQQLYARVVAVENIKYGTGLPPEDPLAFLSANPPTTPKLLRPIANLLVLTDTPELAWTKALTPLGTTFDYYEIQIAQDKNFAFLVEPTAQTAPGNANLTTYSPAAGVLTPAMTYYWRVRSCNDEVPNECSSWSLASTFRVAVAAPTLVVPPDTTNPLRPIFEWNAVNDATSYTIWVSKNPACVAPVTGGTIYGLLFQPKVNLAPSTYYWCVRANSPYYGPGAWSAIDSFIVP
jgi:hypothetical protein